MDNFRAQGVAAEHYERDAEKQQNVRMLLDENQKLKMELQSLRYELMMREADQENFLERTQFFGELLTYEQDKKARRRMFAAWNRQLGRQLRRRNYFDEGRYLRDFTRNLYEDDLGDILRGTQIGF